MIVFDFMGYCRKVPIKKINLKTHADLAKHLSASFTTLASAICIWIQVLNKKRICEVLFHVHHVVRHDFLLKIIIASQYTDVFVNAVHHFSRWMYFNLEEFWVITSKGGSKQAFPVHELVDVLDDTVIDILPAVHALTGKINTTLLFSS